MTKEDKSKKKEEEEEEVVVAEDDTEKDEKTAKESEESLGKEEDVKDAKGEETGDVDATADDDDEQKDKKEEEEEEEEEEPEEPTDVAEDTKTELPTEESTSKKDEPEGTRIDGQFPDLLESDDSDQYQPERPVPEESVRAEVFVSKKVTKEPEESPKTKRTKESKKEPKEPKDTTPVAVPLAKDDALGEEINADWANEPAAGSDEEQGFEVADSGDVVVIEETQPAVVAPAAQSSSHKPYLATDGMGGISVVGIHISQLRLPLVGMFMSAVVLLLSVLLSKDPIMSRQPYKNYCISLPSTTMCCSFLLFLMTCKESLYHKFGKLPNQFVFLWNFVGACIVTFNGPFFGTGNGYFGAWLSVIFSAAALGFSASTFESTVRGMGSLMGLLCSSIIVIIAIVTPKWYEKGSPYRSPSIYTFCVSTVTILLIMLHIFRQKQSGGKSSKGCEGIFGTIAMTIFAALWCAVAGVCTFIGPFLQTGNGYFAVWCGAACACAAAFATRRKSKAERAEQMRLSQKNGQEGANGAEDDDSPV